MNMYDLIIKKKRGGELSSAEIKWMISEFTAGNIPDYQMSAMMMAICFVGMTERETYELTLAMAKSGDVLDLSEISGVKADKHSSGGVGDKISLVLAPLVASAGVSVVKMSGRGLGHTGGTIDKLESFKGFTAELTEREFINNINRIHVAIMAQTADLAPADRKLYALRDVTGTVDQISLIASSIMSKKIASGADVIVLDVKTGNGAFMKTIEEAENLAKEMVSIGKKAGKKVAAVVSDMSQPLGYAVGNALEVREAIEVLHGRGPADVRELALVLGSYMVSMSGRADGIQEARKCLEESLDSGKAFQKFREWISAQGGAEEETDHPELLPSAAYQKTLTAGTDGYISGINTEEIGRICTSLGGGRAVKNSTIDHSVGLVIHKKKTDYVKKGTPLATIYANDKNLMEKAVQRLASVFDFSSVKPESTSLIHTIIE